MGFLEAWGFNPEEAAKAQSRFLAMIEANRPSYSIDEERNAAIPQTVREQLYALESLFRL